MGCTPTRLSIYEDKEKGRPFQEGDWVWWVFFNHTENRLVQWLVCIYEQTRLTDQKEPCRYVRYKGSMYIAIETELFYEREGYVPCES